jgi:hypothetical protein
VGHTEVAAEAYGHLARVGWLAGVQDTGHCWIDALLTRRIGYTFNKLTTALEREDIPVAKVRRSGGFLPDAWDCGGVQFWSEYRRYRRKNLQSCVKLNCALRSANAQVPLGTLFSSRGALSFCIFLFDF